ncbi:hypothetical protein B0H14DRAFT_2561063 [Mycena olivaceomarginata]|nr:hypothetical protein B0H14DRAFT_2561063 [Mycena olivaceomarginata]
MTKGVARSQEDDAGAENAGVDIIKVDIRRTSGQAGREHKFNRLEYHSEARETIFLTIFQPGLRCRKKATCDLGRASECFEAAAERLRTSFKLFKGSVLQQSSTWAPTKSPPWRRRNAFEAWMWLGSGCVILDWGPPMNNNRKWAHL